MCTERSMSTQKIREHTEGQSSVGSQQAVKPNVVPALIPIVGPLYVTKRGGELVKRSFELFRD